MEKLDETQINLLSKPRRRINLAHYQTEKNYLETGSDIHAKNTDKLGTDQNVAEILSKIKAEIRCDPLLINFHINVFSHDGKVELSNTVDFQKHINRSNEIASVVEKVRSVDSEIFAKNDGKKVDPVMEPAMEPVKKSEFVRVEKPRLHTNKSSFNTPKKKAFVKTEPLRKEFQIKITTSHGEVNISGGVESSKSIERIQEMVGKIVRLHWSMV